MRLHCAPQLANVRHFDHCLVSVVCASNMLAMVRDVVLYPITPSFGTQAYMAYNLTSKQVYPVGLPYVTPGCLAFTTRTASCASSTMVVCVCVLAGGYTLVQVRHAEHRVWQVLLRWQLSDVHPRGLLGVRGGVWSHQRLSCAPPRCQRPIVRIRWCTLRDVHLDVATAYQLRAQEWRGASGAVTV